jgi:hypothetical protein
MARTERNGLTYATKYGPVLNYMKAIDVRPYLIGHTGKELPIGKYRTGDVLLFVNTAAERDAFSGLVQREYAKIIEAKSKRK